MKFHDLPMGQQFTFQGEVYVKTGPLVASHGTSGAKKFMARSAVVQVAGEAVPAAPVKDERLVRADGVAAAFEDFYGDCLRLVEGLPEDERAAASDDLAAGRERFLHSLRG